MMAFTTTLFAVSRAACFATRFAAAATLAELEKTCLALTEELQETEAKLASAQEMERKSSREYIAYEKHRAKAEAAKKAREGGAGGGKGFKTSGLS